MKTLSSVLLALFAAACAAPSVIHSRPDASAPSVALPSPSGSASAAPATSAAAPISSSGAPTSEVAGRHCGGWGDGACPSGYRCVDDPKGSCSYERDDDCSGICQKTP